MENVIFLSVILFGSLVFLILVGVPIVFAMGTLSIFFSVIFWGGISSLQTLTLTMFDKVNDFLLSAVPLYILMAAILRYSNLAESLYEAFYRWFAGLKGGLAIATTLISSLFSAMVGVSTVATATLGVVARPSMIKRGYDEKLVSGLIISSSNLGIIIPPSILFIVYAMIAEVSPGAMFMAGILPGVMIAIMMIVYSVIYCWIYPDKGPAIPKEERFSLKEKVVSLKRVILPILIILSVLLSIFLGIATPTEAAGIGVLGSIICAGLNRSLTLTNIKSMLEMTVRLTVMIFWIIIAAAAYAQIVTVTNLGNELSNMILSLNLPPLLILSVVLVIFFILGMFVDITAILFITVPVILPLISSMGYDLVWFGIIFTLSACMANLSPPFGMSLFVFKGVAEDVPTSTLWKSVVPFLFIYMLGIVLLIIFPEIALWLQGNMNS